VLFRSVLAVDGTPLRSWADADGSLRHPITPHDVSPHYLQALLQYEDRWFAWQIGRASCRERG